MPARNTTRCGVQIRDRPSEFKEFETMLFHAVDEYSNAMFHGRKQTIGRGADCVAYEPYARMCLWLVSVSFSS